MGWSEVAGGGGGGLNREKQADWTTGIFTLVPNYMNKAYRHRIEQ